MLISGSLGGHTINFQDSLFFLTLKKVPNTIDCKFVFIALQQNKLGAHPTPPWHCCMMDKNLPAFHWGHHKSWAGAQLHLQKSSFQVTTTVLHCCLQTLMMIPLSSLSANKQSSATAKYFKYWLISPEHLLPFFFIPLPVLSCIVESLGLLSLWELWPFGCRSLALVWTVDGFT